MINIALCCQVSVKKSMLYVALLHVKYDMSLNTCSEFLLDDATMHFFSKDIADYFTS